MGTTKIEWTDKTWSPLRAKVKADAGEISKAKGYTSLIEIGTKMAGHVGPHCERVSHGCDHCYSDTNNGRCLPANGTGLPFDRRARDLVDPFVDEKILMQPLSWRKPVKVFVENQSDLFGEWVPDEQIDRVFAIMALCPQHTFQVLTKRPERMRVYLTLHTSLTGVGLDVEGLPTQPGTYELGGSDGPKEIEVYRHPKKGLCCWAPDYGAVGPGVDDETEGHNSVQMTGLDFIGLKVAWPLPNVWLGVSCENQETADARIPILLQTPAAVRFVSYEPALGPVDFTRIEFRNATWYNALEDHDGFGLLGAAHEKLDWIIVGGESGPGARPFDIAWARQTVEQCKAAEVACFVKQLGAKPFDSSRELLNWPNGVTGGHKPAGWEEGGDLIGPWELFTHDRKGGNWLEWTEDLRLREFPAVSL